MLNIYFWYLYISCNEILFEVFIYPPLSLYLEASKSLMYYPCQSSMYALYLQSEIHDTNTESKGSAPKILQ